MFELGLNERVSTLLADEKPQAAYALLTREAALGEADALMTLASWRVDGSLIERDLTLARCLFGQAADAGHSHAALLYGYFLASGTGGPVEWSQALERLRVLAATNESVSRQLALVDAMALENDGAPCGSRERTLLGARPAVSVTHDFLSREEADYVRDAAAPSLQPSLVVDPGTNQYRRHPIRTSDETMFGVFTTDLVISALNRRIAELSGTAIEQGEPLIVLRYQRGGEYRAHSDALPGTDNQRIATVILYLSTDYRGGETYFTETELTVRGRLGDALLFENVISNGRPDDRARHAGLPIQDGVKWIATRWIRARPYTYPSPKPAIV